MALAPVAYCLWQQFLRYDPENPIWPNRDRFVLSNGHASMLLVLPDSSGRRARSDSRRQDSFDPRLYRSTRLKNFRQLGSKTPGHPEYGLTSGVETTTGPLGQGSQTAWAWPSPNAGWPPISIVPDSNSSTTTSGPFCGDGDMMEGISSEAASIAGHLKLSNLCWIYDNNHITIEGNTDLAFDEDVAARFAAYGWDVAARTRCQRSGRARRRLQPRAQRQRSSEADHRRQPHRLRFAPSPGHQRSPRRGARRRRSQAHQARLRLARRRQVPGARRCPRKFPRCPGQARASIKRTVEATCSQNTAHSIPIWRRNSNACSATKPPDGWDKDLPTFPADPKGIATRDSSSQGPERNRQEPSLADGRLRRFVSIDENAPHLRRRRRFRSAAITTPATSTSAFASTRWAPSSTA